MPHACARHCAHTREDSPVMFADFYVSIRIHIHRHADKAWMRISTGRVCGGGESKPAPNLSSVSSAVALLRKADAGERVDQVARCAIYLRAHAPYIAIPLRTSTHTHMQSCMHACVHTGRSAQGHMPPHAHDTCRVKSPKPATQCSRVQGSAPPLRPAHASLPHLCCTFPVACG